jgi:hypothetical protein
MRRPVSSVYTLQFSLRSRTLRVGFCVAVTLVSLLVAGGTLRIGAAAVFAHSFNLTRLERASTLDPTNPEIHSKLGSYYLYSVQDLDVQKAIHQFRLAITLSPFNATGWSDLAKACDFAGSTVCADRALDRALKLSPMSPRLYWDAALHFIATGRGETALPYFRRLLELDPGYDAAVFRLCPESLEDPGVILREVLPHPGSTKLELDYVEFLSVYGKDDFASRVWSHAMVHASSLPFAWASPFLDALLQTGRVQEARIVWQDLEKRSIVPAPSAADAGNLVFNGGFEHPPLGAGFDWRFNNSPYILVNLQGQGAYRGRRCLRVDFTVGRNDEFEPVNQLVPVEPRHAYRLTAYVKSDSITSDSGPRLRVVDPFCPNCLDVSTEPVLATASWRPVSLTFFTGAGTHLVRLSVWRPRSRSFPFEITGTFWLDAVSLETWTFSSASLARQ